MKSEDYMELSQTMRELISSVRDTNRRLNELKILLKSDFIKSDKKNDALERYRRLTDTKFCLIYSIYDVRQKFIKHVSNELNRESVEKNFAFKTLFRNLSII